MKIPKNWFEILREELSQPYIEELKNFLNKEKEKGITVYPPEEKVFSAFAYTPFEEVKVVIVGQDPYHGEGQAEGLSFSVSEGTPLPPSLKNIFREIASDVGGEIPTSGSLIPWAKQGVLLLNAVLTVRAGEPASHQGKGWERFTDAVIRKLSEKKDPIVFLLWGKAAQKKGEILLSSPIHKVLISAHPSPYSASNFFKNKHFSQTNEFLTKTGKKPIKWL